MSLRFWACPKNTNLPLHLWKRFVILKENSIYVTHPLFKESHIRSPPKGFFSQALIKTIFKKHESKSYNIFTTCIISLADIVCVWSSPIYKVVVRNWERFQLVYSHGYYQHRHKNFTKKLYSYFAAGTESVESEHEPRKYFAEEESRSLWQSLFTF